MMSFCSEGKRQDGYVLSERARLGRSFFWFVLALPRVCFTEEAEVFRGALVLPLQLGQD